MKPETLLERLDDLARDEALIRPPDHLRQRVLADLAGPKGQPASSRRTIFGRWRSVGVGRRALIAAATIVLIAGGIASIWRLAGDQPGINPLQSGEARPASNSLTSSASLRGSDRDADLATPEVADPSRPRRRGESGNGVRVDGINDLFLTRGFDPADFEYLLYLELPRARFDPDAVMIGDSTADPDQVSLSDEDGVVRVLMGDDGVVQAIQPAARHSPIR